MKFTLAILLIIASLGGLDRIAKINKLKKEAKQAYQKRDFKSAISKYHFLLDSMKVDNHRIRLNLANAYFQSNDTTNALNNYGMAAESNLKTIKSTSYQQTGIIQHQQKKYKEALDSFKQAIKSDPTNEDARYNYEMLKKFLKEQEQQQDQQQNKDKKNEDQKDKQDKKNEDQKDKQDKKNEDQKDKQDKKNEDQKDKQDKKNEDQKDKQDEKNEASKSDEEKDDQKKSEETPENAQEKIKEMKISKEKATMILEALKNQEVQYIQQNKKKASKRPKTNKPDW